MPRNIDSPGYTKKSVIKKILGFLFNLLLFLILVAGVLYLQWYGWNWIESTIKENEERGQFGDMFGAINTLFSGLAFAGIIFTILLQSRELSLQRQELAETRNELRLSREAHEKNTAIMDQQLEILRTNAEIEQARYMDPNASYFC